MKQATARAHPNIAFIKYWGNADEILRLPVNSSLSMNLDSLHTTTTVAWDETLRRDSLMINGEVANQVALERVAKHLDVIRERLNMSEFAKVESNNNFPMGAGIASSASAFAALTVAAFRAADVALSERELTTFARRGSGSASRSVPSGYVQWFAGEDHESSYAATFAEVNHWDIVDVIAIVDSGHKKTGSQDGHKSAETSDLQLARVAGAADRIQSCKQAILDENFTQFAEVVEYDSNLMHAVMMTSKPALFYWKPTTLTIMETIREWRQEGIQVCYTLDAGPNVHCICVREHAEVVREQLMSISGVLDVVVAAPGGGTTVITK